MKTLVAHRTPIFTRGLARGHWPPGTARRRAARARSPRCHWLRCSPRGASSCCTRANQHPHGRLLARALSGARPWRRAKSRHASARAPTQDSQVQRPSEYPPP
eukprot:5650167-Pyramimonas_sp.AAC.1